MSGGSARVVGGRYRLDGWLGRGGMGAVWQAHDTLLGRDVAIKEVYLPGAGYGPVDADEPAVRRAMREAQAAARLRHPGIVTVHDVVVQDGRPWIVMELVGGGSLTAAVREHGLLSEFRCAAIGIQVLDALRAAHRQGVLHRDVKPANILLDGDRVVLTDFGIAALDDATGLTATGQMIGSPSYLAPERINGRPATAASDLWALGVTLYTALTGRPPFQGEDTQSTLAAVLHSRPETPAHAGRLWPVIKGLLVKDPAARLTADQAGPLLEAALRTRGEKTDRKRSGRAFRNRLRPDGPEPSPTVPAPPITIAAPTAAHFPDDPATTANIPSGEHQPGGPATVASPMPAAASQPPGADSLYNATTARDPGLPGQRETVPAGREVMPAKREAGPTKRETAPADREAMSAGQPSGSGRRPWIALVLVSALVAAGAIGREVSRHTGPAESAAPGATTTGTSISASLPGRAGTGKKGTVSEGTVSEGKVSEVPAAFAGRWSGRVSQPEGDVTSWKVTIAFAGSAGTGTAESSTPACRWDLTVTDPAPTNREMHLLVEKASWDPRGHCMTTAGLTLRLGQDGRLGMLMRDTGNDSDQATATLTRS
jgi:serine/threonine protein kinase